MVITCVQQLSFSEGTPVTRPPVTHPLVTRPPVTSPPASRGHTVDGWRKMSPGGLLVVKCLRVPMLIVNA